MSRPAALFIMGPTASGKTALAIKLAAQLPCRIISVDSALVYREMDIGTAKPTAAELSRAPHQLIDIRYPHEPYSAANFVEDACQEIDIAKQNGELAVLVGGTMLYHKALLDGLSDLPSADDNYRQQLEQRIAQEGTAALHAMLANIDPESAARIHHNDPQRLIRALDVYQQTGQPLSRLQTQSAPPPASMWDTRIIQLHPEPRATLHALIAKRFQQMIADGFIEEVRALLNKPQINAETAAMRAVGYRQVIEYIEGKLTHEEMIERGIIATRQFAKRQYTWLRNLPYDWLCNPYLEHEMSALIPKVLDWYQTRAIAERFSKS